MPNIVYNHINLCELLLKYNNLTLYFVEFK